MAKAHLKVVEATMDSASMAAPAVRLPHVGQLAALFALGREGSFSGAAASLNLGQPAISKRIRALERSLGVPLAARSGPEPLTNPGREVLAALETYLIPLAASLENLRVTQPALTVALPAGRAGVRAGRVLKAFEAANPGPICVVPAWSNACLALRPSQGVGDCENAFLCADQWAAVAGSNWSVSERLETGELVERMLVASTPEEHEAWDALLEGERPKRLVRATREEAAKLIHTGEAIGIANLAYGHDGLKPVSRRHVWPGTGLWASLQNSARAWDQGWALIEALKAEFASG
ncbi:MAG: LysR family transcriptional regulator [Pseudomonadota bacterium]